MKPILILYHKNCPDGFGAAWAAWKKFDDKAEYLAIEHSAPAPNNLKDRKEIYMVDFCYNKPVMEELLKINQNITVIDHHISAKDTVKLAKNYFYALNHSGSVLSWIYFHKKPIPRILKHIEDIDLWKFKLPFTREIMAALELEGFNFKKWNKIASYLEDSKKRKKYIENGKVLMGYRNKLIERIVNGAEKVNFEKQKAYVANSPVLISEIGNSIVRNKKTIGIIWFRKSGKIIISLRSDGKTDVSKIAVKYGGGGHKAASGFAWDIKKPFPWK